MINLSADALAAAGAVLSGIPLVHRCDEDPIQVLKTGDWIRVDGFLGLIEWRRGEG